MSPLELVDAAIARVEAVNPQLNAVIHERFDKARAEAAGDLPDGPLRGVPMVVKDLDGMTEGDPFHMGTKHLRDLQFVAGDASTMRREFLAAARSTPASAAAAILRAVHEGRTRVLVGGDAKVLDAAFRLFPSRASRWLTSLARRRRGASASAS